MSQGNERKREGTEGGRRNQVMVLRGGKRRQNRWNTKEGGSRKKVMIYKPQQHQFDGRVEGVSVMDGSRRRLILYRPQHQQQRQQQYGGGAFGELVSKKVDKLAKLMSLFGSIRQPLHAPQTHWRTVQHT